MGIRAVGIIVLGAGSLLLLAGCATVPRYTYYRVPCNVPGAIVASPVTGSGQIPTAPDYPVSAVPTTNIPAPTCIVAVSDSGYGLYDRAYYPGYGSYGYGLGRYGSSFGVGIGFGSYGSRYRFGGHHSGRRRH